MGQKVNPIAFRLGYNKEWLSKWFARGKQFANLLEEDIKIRRFIGERLNFAALSKVEIEKASERVRIKLHTARPGIVIGRGGSEIDRLRDELQAMTGKEIRIDIVEVKKPDLDAKLLSENIALQLKKRIPFRRAMKKAVSSAMAAGAGGVRIVCAGRLGGAEMARRESYKEGKVPLHTLKADIDYGFSEANTTYGKIGVKVWIYRGDLLPEKVRQGEEKQQKENKASIEKQVVGDRT